MNLIHNKRSLLLAASMLAAPALIRCRTRDGNAFAYRMPSGIPGDVNRAGSSAVVEPNLISSVNPPLAYGVAVALDPANGIRPIGAGDTAALVYGLYVRPYPTNQQSTSGFFGSNPLGTNQVPPAQGPCDVLKSGYMTVKLYAPAAAVPGGAVYVRIANAGVGQIVGGFEAAADGGNTIQVGAQNTTYFRGAADASGNVEIAFNL